MSVIAPTILAETVEDYKAQVEKLHPFADRVHIDITDGEFAPSFTVGAAQVWWPENWTVDIHAMVARPADHVETLIGLKPNMIIFHAEVDTDMLAVMQQIKQAGIKAGISLQRSTVPETVTPLIEAADHVMIFSGELGRFGGTASLMQLEKIRLIKAINAAAEIGWDGGITIDNAYSITQGGVDVLNVGGAIQKAADPQAAYATLVQEINKHGVI
jgi:ribulose-phosphate 3-epimerase